MTKTKTISSKRIADALRQSGGLISTAADALRCHRATLHRRIQQEPELAAVLEDARETALDEAESVLQRKIREGDTTALIFFLRTQGRKRGYSQGPDVQVSATATAAAPWGKSSKEEILRLVRQARESAREEQRRANGGRLES